MTGNGWALAYVIVGALTMLRLWNPVLEEHMARQQARRDRFRAPDVQYVATPEQMEKAAVSQGFLLTLLLLGMLWPLVALAGLIGEARR